MVSMNKPLFLVLLSACLALHSLGYAQKIGYVDMEFITSKLPEYQKAQAEINQFSEKWAKEIQDKFAEVDRMQRAYMAEEVLLTEEIKRKRLNEIKEKELEARDYNSKVFGMDGLLYQKKKEILKPVLERVQKATEKVVAQRKIDFMFDKSSDFVLVYTNPRHDYTDYVLEELGIDLKPQQASATNILPTTTSPTSPSNKVTKKPN
jgi:outer membrane protein